MNQINEIENRNLSLKQAKIKENIKWSDCDGSNEEHYENENTKALSEELKNEQRFKNVFIHEISSIMGLQSVSLKTL